MKRTVAFLAAVCLSTGILSASMAWAQYSKPSSPPPSQTPPPPPSEASGDTLKAGGSLAPPVHVAPSAQPAKPVAAPAPAPADTMSEAAKARRSRMTAGNVRSIVFSLGLGSAMNQKPDEFNNNFSPSFGGILALGVRQYGVEAAVSFNYNFFLANGTVPNDLNDFMIFADLKYIPTKSKARPYILVCGGYFRQWIVNLDYTENVLGYGGGAGLEMELDKTRRLFVEGRYIEGRTRDVEPKVNADMSNTVIIPFRLGVTWEFK